MASYDGPPVERKSAYERELEHEDSVRYYQNRYRQEIDSERNAEMRANNRAGFLVFAFYACLIGGIVFFTDKAYKSKLEKENSPIENKVNLDSKKSLTDKF
jgi:hypothetical protein